jgi:hypothetical protein
MSILDQFNSLLITAKGAEAVPRKIVNSQQQARNCTLPKLGPL